MALAVRDEPVRQPKYYLVKQHLLELIDTLAPGSAVPTERVLTADLETSRTTVRQALAELVGEGRLVRRQGSGTYVAEPKIVWPLLMNSFTEQAAASGLPSSSRLLSAGRERADADLAARLSIRSGASVFCIQRLRMVDGTPMAVEASYLSAARFPGLIAELRTTPSLYEVMVNVYGAQPTTAQETIETAPASPREAELLGVDTGLPMLVLGRHSFDADHRPLEWVRSWYRGDRYIFVANLSSG
jgi:GntR family transcriptional regulator